MTPPPDGFDLIADERRRQIVGEGYSPAHDQQHTSKGTDQAGPLALAAATYATGASALWPWPNNRPILHTIPSREQRVRELVKAGALIAAEIDRLNEVGADGEPPGWPTDAVLEASFRDQLTDAIREVTGRTDRTAEAAADAIMADLGLDGCAWLLVRPFSGRHHFAPETDRFDEAQNHGEPATQPGDTASDDRARLTRVPAEVLDGATRWGDLIPLGLRIGTVEAGCGTVRRAEFDADPGGAIARNLTIAAASFAAESTGVVEQPASADPAEQRATMPHPEVLEATVEHMAGVIARNISTDPAHLAASCRDAAWALITDATFGFNETSGSAS